MARCSFCRETIPAGTGTMLVKNDGRILLFCSRKCERNLEMGREPRALKWTLAYSRAAKAAKAKTKKSEEKEAAPRGGK